MGASVDLWLLYGFPVTHTTLQVPTKLGDRAPTLHDWFEQWMKEYPNSSVEIGNYGWMGSNRVVPFIGVKVGNECNLREAEFPGTRLGTTLDWIKPPDEMTLLKEFQVALGCTEDIGFYMMLHIG